MAKTETPAETFEVTSITEAPTETVPVALEAPAPKVATDPPQPGCIGYVDLTPLMSVTADETGLSPSVGVLILRGSHEYTFAAAAAIVASGLGRVSAKDRSKLEASGLLNPVSEGTKE